MKLIVNGEPHELPEAATVDALLRDLGADPDHVAVMVNEAVLPRERRGARILEGGDRVEVVSFCGGGSKGPANDVRTAAKKIGDAGSAMGVVKARSGCEG